MVGIRMPAPQRLSEAAATAKVGFSLMPRSVARCKHEMHRELQPVRASVWNPAVVSRFLGGKYGKSRWTRRLDTFATAACAFFLMRKHRSLDFHVTLTRKGRAVMDSRWISAWLNHQVTKKSSLVLFSFLWPSGSSFSNGNQKRSTFFPSFSQQQMPRSDSSGGFHHAGAPFRFWIWICPKNGGRKVAVFTRKIWKNAN